MPRSYAVEYDFKSKPDSLSIVEKSKEDENIAHFGRLMGDFANKIAKRDAKDAGFLSSIFSKPQESYVTLDLNDGLQFKQAREFVNEMDAWVDKKGPSQHADMQGMLSNPAFHIGRDRDKFVVTVLDSGYGFIKEWDGAKRAGDQLTLDGSQMQSFMQEMSGKPMHKTDAAQEALKALEAGGPQP